MKSALVLSPHPVSDEGTLADSIANILCGVCTATHIFSLYFHYKYSYKTYKNVTFLNSSTTYGAPVLTAKVAKKANSLTRQSKGSDVNQWLSLSPMNSSF